MAERKTKTVLFIKVWWANRTTVMPPHIDIRLISRVPKKLPKRKLQKYLLKRVYPAKTNVVFVAICKHPWIISHLFDKLRGIRSLKQLRAVFYAKRNDRFNRKSEYQVSAVFRKQLNDPRMQVFKFNKK